MMIGRKWAGQSRHRLELLRALYCRIDCVRQNSIVMLLRFSDHVIQMRPIYIYQKQHCTSTSQLLSIHTLPPLNA